MKMNLTTVGAAVLALAATSAQATLTTVTAGQLIHGSAQDYATIQSGTFQQHLSGMFMGFINTGRIAVSSPSASPYDIAHDGNGDLVEATPLGTVSSLTMDLASRQVYGINTSGVFLQLTAPELKGVSSGGALTISDLSFDIGTKTVSATIAGGNGVGVLRNVALWQAEQSFTGWTCPERPYAACRDTTPAGGFTLSAGLVISHITPQAQDLFAQSLGLLAVGKSALAGVNEFGFITANVLFNNHGLVPEVGISAVPEPGAWATMGLGLLGLFGVVSQQRRRDTTQAASAH